MNEYLSLLRVNLNGGWEGFTGKVIAAEPASPDGVPMEYVMQPFEIKLSYLGKSWITVLLEVGHNEIGDADVPDYIVPEEASLLLQELGLPPTETCSSYASFLPDCAETSCAQCP